jgi:hypothetical protein
VPRANVCFGDFAHAVTAKQAVITSRHMHREDLRRTMLIIRVAFTPVRPAERDFSIGVRFERVIATNPIAAFNNSLWI